MPNKRDEAADDSPADLPCLETLDSPTGSPPTASLPRLVELENCVSNLNLAHEIFRLQTQEPSLRQEELNSDPPNYNHAVMQLQKIKTILESLLMPGHVRLRSQLDTELIQQELMKTDMVNFTIQTMRPHLLQQAVQYERTKFQQILDKVPAFLDNTTAWLQAAESEEASAVRARSDSPCPDSQSPLSAIAVLNRAYMRLLYWDPQDQKYPETVLMDQVRLDALAQRLQVLLLTDSQCGGIASSLQGFVDKLRQSITALLEDSHGREADLKAALLRLGATVLQQVNQGGASLPQESHDLLTGQISELWKQNHPVRTVIGERVQGFLQAMLQGSPTKRSPELPAPLRHVGAELVELGTAFGRIVHFNRTVFGPFYAPILRKLLKLPEAGEKSR